MFFFYSRVQLKIQEAMRKREKFQREHEDVSTKRERIFFSFF